MGSTPLGDFPSTTSERGVSSTKKEVIREAKRIEESTLCSSKGHFAAAEIWRGVHLWFGIPIVILSALAATLTFADKYQLAVRALAIAVTVLSAVWTFLNPNEQASAHLRSGNSYDALCSKTRIFWTIDCWGADTSDQQLTMALKDLSEEKNKLNQTCPQIPGRAYRKGKRGIQAGETRYDVDKESR